MNVADHGDASEPRPASLRLARALLGGALPVVAFAVALGLLHRELSGMHLRAVLEALLLTAEEQHQIDAEGGLVVEGVQGAAEEAGIRPGDVMLSATGKPVRSIEDLRAAVSGSRDHIALLVQRGDGRLLLPVDLG